MLENDFIRFASKTVIQSDGCIMWTGTKQHHGYGRISIGGRQGKDWMAHRLAYEHWIGPIPDNVTLDHLCQVSSCVNPTHLEPVSQSENTRRGHRPDPDKCGHGLHDWTEENWYYDGKGQPYCAPCNRKRSRRR